MHRVNRMFWKRTAQRYPRWFTDPSKVVEFGSLDVNGSVRDYCPTRFYVGVDWRPGPRVEMVCLAHDAPFAPESIDTILSASMLEHDPYWEKSLAKMVEILRPDGLLALSWGAARNAVHDVATAPDYQFHALKAGLAIAHLERLGVHIQEFQYEQTIQGHVDGNSGLGEVVLVGFKDASLLHEPLEIDALLPEDRIA